MRKEFVEKLPIICVGIKVRTSYEQELGLHDDKSQIYPTVMNYYHQGMPDKIPGRKNPGTTLCAYTEYESDYKGAYSYFIGEEVTEEPESLAEGFCLLKIPAQRYAKFTSEPKPMPAVVQDSWKAIWQMDKEKLGGTRCYHTDYEIYDERAQDHNAIVMDFFIGIQ
jgi:predicted transcriptional regulator YdeE